MRIRVESSWISTLQFEATTIFIGPESDLGVMLLETTDGSVYKYIDVPRHIYEGMLASKSKGTFYHDRIRGNYDYTVSGDRAEAAGRFDAVLDTVDPVDVEG